MVELKAKIAAFLSHLTSKSLYYRGPTHIGIASITIGCLVLQSACALRPAWQQLADDGALDSRWLDTGRFRHLVLANQVRGNHLRIYVEGDGTPWIHETRLAVDPTPNNPVMLRLMHDDKRPGVYLGRPCYFGSATDKGCGPRWWTFDRYGKAVVDSMCEAANTLSRERGAASVALIGYSGGAAIVLGMRTCTEKLTSITTIAGNLDPDAWTAYHNYTPLEDLSPLEDVNDENESILETHWQCRDDANVPPSITDTYFVQHKNAIRRIVANCTHATGWERYWSRMTESNNVE